MKTLLIKLTRNAVIDQEGYFADASMTVDGETVDGVTVYFNLIAFDGDIPDDEAEFCDWSNPDGARFNGEWIADKFEGCNDFRGYEVVYFNTDGSVL